MGALSVRELNANISRALARVQGGETLRVLKKGEVIAEISPPRQRSAEWLKAFDESVAFMRQGLPLNVGKITEDDKYGDAEL